METQKPYLKYKTQIDKINVMLIISCLIPIINSVFLFFAPIFKISIIKLSIDEIDGLVNIFKNGFLRKDDILFNEFISFSISDLNAIYRYMVLAILAIICYEEIIAIILILKRKNDDYYYAWMCQAALSLYEIKIRTSTDPNSAKMRNEASDIIYKCFLSYNKRILVTLTAAVEHWFSYSILIILVLFHSTIFKLIGKLGMNLSFLEISLSTVVVEIIFMITAIIIKKQTTKQLTGLGTQVYKDTVPEEIAQVAPETPQENNVK